MMFWEGDEPIIEFQEFKVDDDREQVTITFHVYRDQERRMRDTITEVVKMDTPFDTDLMPSIINAARRRLAERFSTLAESLRRAATEGSTRVNPARK